MSIIQPFATLVCDGGRVMPRVCHFEIHAENPERAIAFYRNLFHWEFTSWGGPMEYWIVRTGPAGEPGIDGGLIRRKGPGPADGCPVIAYVCTVRVTDLDASLRAVERHGGSIALAKMAVPGVGWLAYGKDTESNIFGMMQDDPAAK
jgi:predicted enzyme related to lactoylglutathione lyase